MPEGRDTAMSVTLCGQPDVVVVPVPGAGLASCNHDLMHLGAAYDLAVDILEASAGEGATRTKPHLNEGHPPRAFELPALRANPEPPRPEVAAAVLGCRPQAGRHHPAGRIGDARGGWRRRGMSDKQMDKLPERGATGVGRKTQVRTVVSGVVADVRRLVGRLRERRRRT